MSDLERGADPPEHLSPAAAGWWACAVLANRLGERERLLLTAAAESWDRANAARRIVDAEGEVTFDRFGQPRAHPAVAVERDARAAFAKTMREMELQPEAPSDSAVDQLRRQREERQAALRGSNDAA